MRPRRETRRYTSLWRPTEQSVKTGKKREPQMMLASRYRPGLTKALVDGNRTTNKSPAIAGLRLAAHMRYHRRVRVSAAAALAM